MVSLKVLAAPLLLEVLMVTALLEVCQLYGTSVSWVPLMPWRRGCGVAVGGAVVLWYN